MNNRKNKASLYEALIPQEGTSPEKLERETIVIELPNYKMASEIEKTKVYEVLSILNNMDNQQAKNILRIVSNCVYAGDKKVIN